MWFVYENLFLSGKYFVSNLFYNCLLKMLVFCNFGVFLDGIIFYGEDSRGDIYVFVVNGLYRMVSLDLCNIECIVVLLFVLVLGFGSFLFGCFSVLFIFVFL